MVGSGATKEWGQALNSNVELELSNTDTWAAMKSENRGDERPNQIRKYMQPLPRFPTIVPMAVSRIIAAFLDTGMRTASKYRNTGLPRNRPTLMSDTDTAHMERS
jgi:hypothetical protein